MGKGVPTTEKQKKVLGGIARGKSQGRAMLDAGYSKSYSRSSLIKQTDTWKENVRKYLTDKAVVKAVESLVNSTTTQTYIFPINLKEPEVYAKLLALGHRKKDCVIFKDKRERGVAGFVVTDKYWKCYVKVINGTDLASGTDRAIRIKGRYAPEQLEVDINRFADIDENELTQKILDTDKKIKEIQSEIGVKSENKT